MLLSSPKSNPIYLCKDVDHFSDINFHLWKTDPKVDNKVLYNKSDESEDDPSDDWGDESEDYEDERVVKDKDLIAKITHVKENIKGSLESTVTQHQNDSHANSVLHTQNNSS